jgi:hypothetical protein
MQINFDGSTGITTHDPSGRAGKDCSSTLNGLVIILIRNLQSTDDLRFVCPNIIMLDFPLQF